MLSLLYKQEFEEKKLNSQIIIKNYPVVNIQLIHATLDLTNYNTMINRNKCKSILKNNILQ